MDLVPQHRDKLVVVLIRPTKYDDGYLLQWRRGALPSNSLAVMHALTETAFSAPELSHLASTRVETYDEMVNSDAVDPHKIMARLAAPDTTVVVGLVGVQTNMFPRACDLAYAFQEEGAIVVIGGFHVSGSISMLHDLTHPAGTCPHPDDPFNCEHMPKECAQIMRDGIVIFHGEAELLLPSVLRDICAGTHKPLYYGGLPDISNAAMPTYPDGYFDGFLARLNTLDSSRGCPFKCSFCSIINVQGNEMRFRSIDGIINWIKSACAERGDVFWFFTDDNFARNPAWEEMLLRMINLHKIEGLKFRFMIQADLAAYRIKGKKTGRPFIELLAEAGCTQVFNGVETVRQESLQKTGKPQNQVAHYRKLCNLYHEVGIAVHASYIIGFPDDTPESVAEDIETLKGIDFDQASFYILSPIPGSRDHLEAYRAGTWMNQDFNEYDSFRPVTEHPMMTTGEWQETYNKAWRQFYTVDQMVSALKRVNPKNYWGFFRTLLWYRWSSQAERVHPMLGGFWRIKRWKNQRPGPNRISFPRHCARELLRAIRLTGCLMREYYTFQDVYFQTRWMPIIKRKMPSMSDVNQSLRERRMAVQRLSEECAERFRKSTWFGRTFGRAAHRKWLNQFWIKYGHQKWKLFYKPHWHLYMLPHAFSEAWYWGRFNLALARAMVRENPW